MPTKEECKKAYKDVEKEYGNILKHLTLSELDKEIIGAGEIKRRVSLIGGHFD